MVEVAFKDGVLEVVAKVAAGLKDFAQALVIRDVVANKVGGAHGVYRCLPGHEGDVFRDFSGEAFGEDARLEFEGAAVADFVFKDRMGNE